MLVQIVGKAVYIFRKEGLRGIRSRVFRGRRRLAEDDFDRKHGVTTSGDVPLWKLKIGSASWTDGVFYHPVSERIFSEAVQHLPVEPREYTFVDLGSGKGRALILASERGFGRVIGVEFSPELCEVARRNVSSAVEIVCQDAAEFIFPDTPTVVFLYNPFGAETLAKVIPHIKLGSYLIYVNPYHGNLFLSMPIYMGEGLSIWKL